MLAKDLATKLMETPDLEVFYRDMILGEHYSPNFDVIDISENLDDYGDAYFMDDNGNRLDPKKMKKIILMS